MGFIVLYEATFGTNLSIEHTIRSDKDDTRVLLTINLYFCCIYRGKLK